MITIGAHRFPHNTIPAQLEQHARQFPDSICYRFPQTGQVYTWKELWQEVQQVAGGLIRLGLKKGDRVALLMEGSRELVVSLYATITAGGVAAPLSTYLTLNELKVALAEVQPTVFIMGSAAHHLCHRQLEATAGWLPKHVFIQGGAAAPQAPFREYTGLKSPLLQPVQGPGEEPPLVSLQDPVFLLFSSGTTGVSKGVLRSTAAFMARRPSTKRARRKGRVTPFHKMANAWLNRFRVLSLLPLYHLAGIGILLLPLQVCNVQVVLPARFHPGTALRLLQAEKIHFLMSTPHMVQALLAQEAAAHTKLDAVLGIVFASAALPASMIGKLRAAFKNLYFFMVSYGATETGSVATGICFTNNRRNRPLDLLMRLLRRGNWLDGEIPLAAFENTPASMGGKIARQVAVGIRHVETGQWLPADAEGEIMIQSHKLVPAPDGSNEGAGENWYPSGDLGYKTAGGLLLITGRRKLMISRGGEKIAPAEVEQAMGRFPGIAEALVLGLPDALYGEIVGAAFTEKEEGAVAVAQLQQALRQVLSPFKVPVCFLVLPAFPLNAAGKIDVMAVRTALLAQIAQTHA